MQRLSGAFLALVVFATGCGRDAGSGLASADVAADSCAFRAQPYGFGQFTNAIPVALDASLLPLQVGKGSTMVFTLTGQIASPSNTTCELTVFNEHGTPFGLGFVNAYGASVTGALPALADDGHVHFWKVRAARVVFNSAGQRQFVSTDDAHENFEVLVAWGPGT